MNLHQIVAPAISVVNPFQPATIQFSMGYSTNPDGSRTPKYSPPVAISAQVQELKVRDLWHLQGLGMTGSTRKIYVNGEIDAIERVSEKGGDLITAQDGHVWLTTSVLEQWPDWCCVSVTLQTD